MGNSILEILLFISCLMFIVQGVVAYYIFQTFKKIEAALLSIREGASVETPPPPEPDKVDDLDSMATMDTGKALPQKAVVTPSQKAKATDKKSSKNKVLLIVLGIVAALAAWYHLSNGMTDTEVTLEHAIEIGKKEAQSTNDANSCVSQALATPTTSCKDVLCVQSILSTVANACLSDVSSKKPAALKPLCDRVENDTFKSTHCSSAVGKTLCEKAGLESRVKYEYCRVAKPK